MRKLLALLLLIPLRLFAANGDITGLTVSNWVADIYINGLNTNGTYNHGMEVPWKRDTHNAKVVVTVDTPGGKADGTVGVNRRYVLIDNPITKVWPDELANDESFDPATSIVRLRCRLSDYITAEDTVVGATFQSGYYTENGTNSTVATLTTVTNLSVITPPFVIARHTWPQMRRITNTTDTLRAIGFHWSSGYEDGKPLAFVQFILTGLTSGLVVTQTVAAPTIDYAMPDVFPTADYNATVDMSGFTDNERVKTDIIFAPWFGSTNWWQDTRSGRVKPYIQPITNLYDPDNDYSRVYAIVDPAGVNASGVAADSSVLDPTANANYFLDIAGAITAIAGTNNTLFGHNDLGGATIYIRNGYTNWTGAAHSVTAHSATYLTITPYPGHTPSLTHRLSDRDAGQAVRFYQMDIAAAAAQAPFSGENYLWFDECTLAGNTQTAHSIGELWITHSDIGAWGQGISPIAGQFGEWYVRGCEMDANFDSMIACELLMGSRKLGSTLGMLFNIQRALVTPDEGFEVYYNNFISGFAQGTATGINVFNNATNMHHGLAIVNCVFERITDGIAGFGTFGRIGYHATNLLMFNTSFFGQRSFLGYNDAPDGPFAPGPWNREFWILKNVRCSQFGNKSDRFANTNVATGNWPIMYRVGCSGEMAPGINETGASGSFDPYVLGLSSYDSRQDTALDPVYTNVMAFEHFVNFAASDESNNGAGNGNYRMYNDNPFPNLSYQLPVPFDLDGYPFRRRGYTGPYSSHDMRFSEGSQ